MFTTSRDETNQTEIVRLGGNVTPLHRITPKSSSVKTKWLLAGGLSLVAVAGLSLFNYAHGLSSSVGSSTPPLSSDSVKAAPPVVTVTTEAAKIGIVSSALTVTGSISAIDPLTIGSQASGLSIVQVLAEEGDYVRKGQVLCILDSSILQAQLKGMEARMVGSRATALKAVQPNRQEDIAGLSAAYQQALADVQQRQAMVTQMEASLVNARSNARRYKDLLKEGAVSQQESDNHSTEEVTAFTNLQGAKEQFSAAKFFAEQSHNKLEMAQRGGRREDIIVSEASADETAASVQQLRAQIEQTIIRAPDEGLVTKRYAHIGDVASTGKALFEMIRKGQLELRAQVTQSDLSRLRPGITAALSDSVRSVQGTIFQISPTVDSATRLGTVRISIPSNSGFRPGMFVQGSVQVGQADALLVPNSSVLADGEQNYVFLYQNGKAKKQQVTVGSRTSESAEIKSGVSVGDAVIVAGAGFLEDNDVVALSK
ncbi:MAG: HlyD protein [Cyanobacteriota bacterium erpe_2018_sw_21hr_WHONDRS-SW48-000092_B_bin.40]|jgi:HlyD family secretion protein|nr:HlyD protein [Cyanobacteriota bacterium erpe_2018_sw_21hr_WHONDRS-SW48-000092_B_bin.40]